MSKEVARDRNGKEIRVGDRVRCVKMPWANLREGEEGIVTKIESEGTFHVNDSGGCNSPYWEKVEESELERLVRKANEGLEANKKIRKSFRAQVEERKVNVDTGVVSTWRPYDDYANEYFEYRVKPKPTFTPFTVGKNWRVELSEDQKRLTIGCQTFHYTVGKFSDAFKSIQDGVGAIGFIPTARGAKHEPLKETIPWADVDKIIKALEEVGA